MSRGTVEAVKSLISNRAQEVKDLQIGWFGGEPLLASGVVLEISQHAKALADAEYSTIKRFSSSMSTNGSLLTVDLLEKLVGVGVNTFQISLDGDRDAHDTTRTSRTGGKSFDRIWKNLQDARRSTLPFRIGLRVHVHSFNVDAVARLIDQIRLEFSGDERFFVYFKRIEALPGTSKQFAFLPKANAAEAIREFTLRLHGSSLEARPRELGDYCYAGFANSFVIRSDGGLAKCTVDFENPANQVGYLNSDGSLSMDNQKLRPWLLPLLAGQDSEAKCPLGSVSRAAKIEKVIPISIAHST